jgi:cytosine/adenosine deaminase-related metal-dependent hydrolase
MKEADNGHWGPDALARWNRLPSEVGRPVLVRSAGGAVALRRERGVWSVVSAVEADGAIVVDMPTKVILPAFANAHTHLDLTHIGPRPYDPTQRQGFASWVQMVIRERLHEPDAIRASVRLGLEKSLAGGVAAVGDIAGIMRMEPVEEMRASPVAGVSFVEFFGTGGRQAGAVEAMRALAERGPVSADGVRLGLQPHALYSAGPEVFAASGPMRDSTGVALSTHIAESMEERRLLTGGEGPMRDFLESIGLGWSEPPVLSPTAMFASSTRADRWLLAHANDLSDDDIQLLRTLGASVAFCARGHRYFGHLASIGPHRWRDVRAAGVLVCLSTDSIINLPHAHEDRISPLDDAREVFHVEHSGDERHDAELATTLLDMITVQPARALDMSESLFTLALGAVLGVVAVEVGELGGRSPALAAIESDATAEFLALSDKRQLDAAGLLWARNHA